MNNRSLLLPVLWLMALAGCSSVSSTRVAPPDATPLATTISAVQGSGSLSPLQDAVVSVSGLVTGDFQHNDPASSGNLGGFFMQSADPDSDPRSSEGIFVFDGTLPAVDVAVGDAVVVQGTVREHQGETRIEALRVAITGTGSVRATQVNFPADLERYEGMLIHLPQALTVAGLYELERFGTVLLFAGARPFSYTNQNRPDVTAYAAHRAEFARHTLLLDDGHIEQNLAPIRYLATTRRAGQTLRGGDRVSGLTGNLRYGHGNETDGVAGYRLMPTAEPQFESRNPRPTLPAPAGPLRVAGFNALNFFSSIDTGIDRCGPTASGGCRGADSPAELERQLGKLVTTLAMLDADIIGLMEIENNGGIALQMIVQRLNGVSGRQYDFIATGLLGGDVITTAFIYDSTSVEPLGDPAVLDGSADARFDVRRNRPALAQAFRQHVDGAILSVVVNHLKSKGSTCDDSGDVDLGDGQGDCNRTRTRAAAALADWAAADPTGSGDPDYLVIGDFNAFVFEDPLTALAGAGLVNLVQAAAGGAFYSSVFRGEYGALDHAFANASLLPQVRAAIAWHINADEPRVLDYNLEYGRDPTLFNPDSPYRSSDHDPIVIDLQLSP